MWESGRVQLLPLDSIGPNPDQPRQVFSAEELEGLAASIRALGILQPLTVRRAEGGWQLVAGERRLRAARLAGLAQVPCLTVQVDDQCSSLLALVENLQRKDLDFWEEAQAISRLLATYHLSQEEVARRLGRSQSAVANKLRLLRLPMPVVTVLRGGGCTERHARALLRLDDPAVLLETAQLVVSDKLTVAQTEELVERLLAPSPPPAPKPKRTFIPKDVRLFLNTLTRGVDLMRSAGVAACCQREDLDGEILLTIRIPNGTRRQAGV